MQMEELLFIGKYIHLKSLLIRAAETCAIDCAKILLEHNADIDA